MSRNKPRPEISFIVSAYDRPTYLRACLATLAIQSVPHEIIVCINHHDPVMNKRNLEVCKYFGAKPLMTGSMGARECYESGEMGAKVAKGDWLVFPSDDSLYVACFSDLMLKAAKRNKWDLVYCNAVYDPMSRLGWIGERYGLMYGEPILNHVDKTTFMVNAKWFDGFPGKRSEGAAGPDFMLIEDLVRRGISHGLAMPRPHEGYLVVHQ